MSHAQDFSPLTVRPAVPDDIQAIHAIIYASCVSDPIAVQLMEESSLESYTARISDQDRTIIEDLSKYYTQFVVAAENDTGKIICYGKWLLPVPMGNAMPCAPELPPYAGEARKEFLGVGGERNYWNQYWSKMGTLDAELKPDCRYELESLATLPEYRCRGAGSLIMQWGIERADKDGLPIYLEASCDGHAFYKRFGFFPWAMTLEIDMKDHGGKGLDRTVPLMRQPVRIPDSRN